MKKSRHKIEKRILSPGDNITLLVVSPPGATVLLAIILAVFLIYDRPFLRVFDPTVFLFMVSTFTVRTREA